MFWVTFIQIFSKNVKIEEEKVKTDHNWSPTTGLSGKVLTHVVPRLMDIPLVLPNYSSLYTDTIRWEPRVDHGLYLTLFVPNTIQGINWIKIMIFPWNIVRWRTSMPNLRSMDFVFPGICQARGITVVFCNSNKTCTTTWMTDPLS